jgi:methionyl aminopeptidase
MSIDSEEDLAALRRVGRAVALAIRAMRAAVQPGMTTADLDAVGAKTLAEHGARSAPRLVYGFPGETCISVNDEAVHGIPGGRIIRPGDLVKLDVTAELAGYYADAAVSVAVPPVAPATERLRI